MMGMGVFGMLFGVVILMLFVTLLVILIRYPDTTRGNDPLDE